MRAAAWEVCEQSENVGAPTSGNDTTKMDTLVAAASDAVIADIPEFVREPPQSRRRTGYPSYSAEHRPPQARAEEQHTYTPPQRANEDIFRRPDFELLATHIQTILLTTQCLVNGRRQGVPLANDCKLPSKSSVCEVELRLGKLSFDTDITKSVFNTDIENAAFLALSAWAATHCDRSVSEENIVEILDPKHTEDVLKMPPPIQGSHGVVPMWTGAMINSRPTKSQAFLRRITSNGSGGGQEQHIQLQAKHKVYITDLLGACGMPGAFDTRNIADIRMAVNVETDLTAQESMMQYKLVKKRVRSRTHYTFKRNSALTNKVVEQWHVDLTKVSGGAAANDPVTFECEFEIDAHFLTELLGGTCSSHLAQQTDAQQGRPGQWNECVRCVGEFANDMALFIMDMLRATSCKHYYFGDIGTTVFSNGANLMRAFRLDKLCDESCEPFCGSMPCNMHRTDLALIAPIDELYHVAEKTDGVRHIMIVSGTSVTMDNVVIPPSVYLVDRSLHVVSMSLPIVQSRQKLRCVNDTHCFSVIDGELARDLSTMKPMYLAFDLLVLDGQRIDHESFSNRYCKLVALVNDLNRDTQKFGLKSTSLRIVVKVQRSVRDISDVFRGMSLVAQRDASWTLDPSHASLEALTRTLARIYSVQEYKCKVDGLVFTPNTPYVVGTDARLLKWKFPETWTVDVAVPFVEGTSVAFAATVPNGVNALKNICVVILKTRFTDMEFNALMTELRHANAFVDGKEHAHDERLELTRPWPIVECTFDHNSGMWRYLGMRKDKCIPNHVSTIFDTMMVQAENVTVDELLTLYKLASSIRKP